MDRVKVSRSEADVDAQWLCDEIDAKGKEYDKLHSRFPILCVVAFLAVGGVADVLHGRDEAILRTFGEFGVSLPFLAVPVFIIWAISDWSRMKAVSRESAAARARLTKRGYEYWGTGDGGGSLYRLPRDSA